MKHRAIPAAVAAAALAHPATGRAQAVAAPPSAACAVYAAAIAAVAGDTAAVVVVDSTFAGVPRFAFNAYSGFRRTPEEQGLAYPDSTQRAFAAANAARTPLAACGGALGRVRLVGSDSLVALFRRDGDGWERFRARYAGARGFIGVSRPLFGSDSASALVYVAEATGWLSGTGRMVRLERDGTGRWIRRAEAVLWVS